MNYYQIVEEVKNANTLPQAEKIYIEIRDIVENKVKSRTCESCKYYNSINESSGLCEQEDLPPLGIDNDFGCNKWEKKDAT